MTKKLCGYELVLPFHTDIYGTYYHARKNDGGEDTIIRLVGHFEPNPLPSKNSKRDFNLPIHEIIISDPPCEDDPNPNKSRQFHVLIDGKIETIILDAHVRKPGYWATTTIRIATELLNNHPSNNLRILDLGCGSGIIGVVLSKHPKVKHVVFSDIDKTAAGCTSKNANKYSIKDFQVRVGNLFDPFTNNELFDLIIFGPPFYPSGIGINNSIADVNGRLGNELVTVFAKNVKNFLSKGGLSLTYIAEYIDYAPILNALAESHLSTRTEYRHILYPYIPKHNFPPSNEIIFRQELESFCNYKFLEENFNDRTFLGFQMVHFISGQKTI